MSVLLRASDCIHIQLFRERLSEKVHATILKGIVGGFEFTVVQRNLKEWYEVGRLLALPIYRVGASRGERPPFSGGEKC